MIKAIALIITMIILVSCGFSTCKERYEVYNEDGTEKIDTCDYRDCYIGGCSYRGCDKYDGIDDSGKNYKMKGVCEE